MSRDEVVAEAAVYSYSAAFPMALMCAKPASWGKTML